MKFRNLLTAAVALGLIASANPTQQFLTQEESESEVSTEVSESSDNATENTDEETSEVVSEDSSTESNVELSEEEASKLAIRSSSLKGATCLWSFGQLATGGN